MFSIIRHIILPRFELQPELAFAPCELKSIARAKLQSQRVCNAISPMPLMPRLKLDPDDMDHGFLLLSAAHRFQKAADACHDCYDDNWNFQCFWDAFNSDSFSSATSPADARWCSACFHHLHQSVRKFPSNIFCKYFQALSRHLEMKDVIYVHKCKPTGNHKRHESSQISKVHNFIILGVHWSPWPQWQCWRIRSSRNGKRWERNDERNGEIGEVSEKFLPDFSCFQWKKWKREW